VLFEQDFLGHTLVYLVLLAVKMPATLVSMSFDPKGFDSRKGL
jgi:hypothetical protein